MAPVFSPLVVSDKYELDTVTGSFVAGVLENQYNRFIDFNPSRAGELLDMYNDPEVTLEDIEKEFEINFSLNRN